MKSRYENSLLKRKNVVGCAVGFKEVDEEMTDDLAIVTYVSVEKTDNIDREDLVPTSLEGIMTDVQENFPLLGRTTIAASYAESGLGAVPAETCMERQKMLCLDKRIRNKVDLATFGHVELRDIEKVVQETGLFVKEYGLQMKQDQKEGSRRRLESGSSIGRYLVPIEQVFPGADTFMKAVERRVKGKTSDSDTRLESSSNEGRFRLLPGEIPGIGKIAGEGEPALSMKVWKKGRTTGVTEGVIIGLDASLFIDYPHGAIGTRDKVNVNQPIFSPSPLDGGRFPIDVVGMLRGFVPVDFPSVKTIGECRNLGLPKRTLFVEQIVTTKMAEPGDSGAVLVGSEDMYIVGLLFAGGQQCSFFNTAENVTKSEGYIEVRVS